MKLAKIFLNGILCVVLSGLFLLGFGLINFNPNTTSKAEEPSSVNIRYWAISTNSDIYAGRDSDNNGDEDAFADVAFNPDTKKATGFTLDGGMQNVDANIFAVTPTKNEDGSMAISTIFEGVDFELSGYYVNGRLIDKKVGWLYDSNPSGTGNDFSLTSLYNTFGSNILPADFLTNPAHYSPKSIDNNEIDLYCIINPFVVSLYPDNPENLEPLGGFESEDPLTPGVIDGNISVYTTNVGYKEVKHDFKAPKPYEPQKYRFDGYYTDPVAGDRITNRYGDMSGGIYSESGWVLGNAELYARYVRVYNVTYYYTYNNAIFKGDLQFEISSNTTKDELDLAVVHNSAINQSTNTASPFPTDKVIAEWFTNESLENAQSFPLTAQNITIYAKLAETHYDITFDANGGRFIDAGNSTQKTYTMEYGQSLGDAITKLTNELGASTAVANRTGYNCNNRNWAAEKNTTQALSAAYTYIKDNMVVYLIWYQKEYTIEYHTDGTISKTKESNVHYGDKLYDIVKKVTPVRTGYNFIGWAYSTSSSVPSYTLDSRPNSKVFNYSTSITLTFINDEVNDADIEYMPDNNIHLYGVWIQAYTIRFSLNQGYPIKVENTPLVFNNNNIIITVENGENLGQALNRQQIGDFFTNANYFPTLPNCSFEGWYYYTDGNFTNNAITNAYQLTSALLSMNIQQLQDINIDLTKDGVVAAKYSYNKESDPYYTTAPEETANTVFAIILMIISVVLLVMLVLSHRGNSTLEINDKAINAYKQIYGEDAPLPTFKSTKPPFDTGEEYEISDDEQSTNENKTNKENQIIKNIKNKNEDTN